MRVLQGFIIKYPAPSNITYLWNFGFLGGMCIIVQLITGIFLAMHYTPHINLAFPSVEHIMRDVNNGWLLRYTHSNGASMFFIVIYLHIMRGLYYGSYIYPRELLWCSGVIIFLLMIITAFLGYVLPWGQMSFWGATVITNLFSAIPIVGREVVNWIWGAFSIENATLTRFFSLHFVLPFILVGVILIHLVFLHERGSNNPLSLNFIVDEIPFHPYFIVKDLYGLIIFSIIFIFIIGYCPNMMGHPDNYIVANPLVTPEHIVPEWYFLVFYAILRSIPDKLGGVVSLACSIIVLLLLPFIFKVYIEPKSTTFKPTRVIFWFFIINCLILGWMGSNPVIYPYFNIGIAATLGYFLWFPLLGTIVTANHR